MSMAECVQFLRDPKGPRVVCSSDESVLRSLQEQGIAVNRIQRPGSVEVARLGAQKIAAGEIVSPEALDAKYIRSAEFTKVSAG
jgi:hypothetical protein